MRAPHFSRAAILRGVALIACLTTAQPAFAQDPAALQTLRGQYDALMADFERLAESRGDKAMEAEARRGRDAMQSLTDEQLAAAYSRMRVPDLSVATMASRYLVRPAEARAEGGAGDLIQPLTAGFPVAAAIPAGCNGVDIGAETRSRS